MKGGAMFKTGKCPSCGTVPASINMQAVDLRAANGATYYGVMYVCPTPACHAILGVGVDHIAQQNGIAAAVLNAMKR